MNMPIAEHVRKASKLHPDGAHMHESRQILEDVKSAAEKPSSQSRFSP